MRMAIFNFKSWKISGQLIQPENGWCYCGQVEAWKARATQRASRPRCCSALFTLTWSLSCIVRTVMLQSEAYPSLYILHQYVSTNNSNQFIATIEVFSLFPQFILSHLIKHPYRPYSLWALPSQAHQLSTTLTCIPHNSFYFMWFILIYFEGGEDKCGTYIVWAIITSYKYCYSPLLHIISRFSSLSFVNIDCRA